MKKNSFLITLVLTIFCFNMLSAQQKSCCTSGATNEFAMLGSDAAFKSAHLSPEPFHFVASKGGEISFPVTGGNDAKAFFVKAGNQSTKYLFIFHEWWGLNDYMKQEAERFAMDFPDVNIMAIDLYDGKIATNAEDAGKLMQSMDKARGEAIIQGAQNYVGPSASIQTLGWCFGGGWSMQAAILLGKQATGCVIYYGMPESDQKKLSTLNAPVFGIFALKDEWITKTIVEAFEAKMKELQKPVTINFFNADHAFANPSNPKFDEAATAKARIMAVGFLKKNFGK